jgi:putative restriction endonuclease
MLWLELRFYENAMFFRDALVEKVARRKTAGSTLVPDIKSIISARVDATTKEILVNARLGQGAFRAHVLAYWGMQCCVTGTRTLDAVRASHIKPWRDSNNEERLDSNNGLPLVATLDALFDAGLITFSPDGKLLTSKLRTSMTAPG